MVGTLKCKTCNFKFRFKNKNEATKIIKSLRTGGTASDAILREISCFNTNPSIYPFTDNDSEKLRKLRDKYFSKG